MTKKHFKLLARALLSCKPTQPPEDIARWRVGVASVADVCQESNPRFDRDRFYEAVEYHK